MRQSPTISTSIVPLQWLQRPTRAGATDDSVERPHATQYTRNTRLAARRCAARCSADSSSTTRKGDRSDLRVGADRYTRRGDPSSSMRSMATVSSPGSVKTLLIGVCGSFCRRASLQPPGPRLRQDRLIQSRRFGRESGQSHHTLWLPGRSSSNHG